MAKPVANKDGMELPWNNPKTKPVLNVRESRKKSPITGTLSKGFKFLIASHFVRRSKKQPNKTKAKYCGLYTLKKG
ncbi:hypothetical protein LPTSP4_06490 [Leptospira ryugenii]|uniref:Uncharacterized protein n=1 Tax=Leptospira ryugenii TaxID=1917863 RepID=A0A2P2DWX7_9LEPT|nr:hypothetical protein LPTSP4_06490 [Leptospira ryugenii]